MTSTETNLLIPSEQVRHAIQPAGCPPANVTTIVVTRYWVDPAGGRPVRPDDDYFTRRAELFSRYTYASMVSQTRTPDAWILLISPWAYGQLDERTLWQIENLPWAHWVIVPTGRAFSSFATEWVDTWMGTDLITQRPYIAQVRLDNDDALAVDYVHALGCWITRARPATPSTVVFPHGIQAHHHTGDRFVDMHAVNHFSAVVTTPGDRQVGAFGPNHTEIYKEQDLWPHTRGGIYQVGSKYPMWAEVLHQDNAANHPRPGAATQMTEAEWDNRFGG